jgi:hypothetical protein
MHMPIEVPMALSAVVFPILPGKTAEWRAFIDELNGPKRSDFVESRIAIGARERTFLQPTPMGDLVIVTLEGDDPNRSFGQFVSSKDAFTLWFLERVKAIHGIDLSVPMPPPSSLVVDSSAVGSLVK